jgi:hypothetical protein
MKVMRKERILAKDHGDYVRAEREVLTAVFHPYIVTLRCSFQVSPRSQHAIVVQILWVFPSCHSLCLRVISDEQFPCV